VTAADSNASLTITKPLTTQGILVPVLVIGIFVYWLFLPEVRLFGVGFLLLGAVLFLLSPRRVQVTPSEIVLIAPLRTVRYDLRELKYVTIDSVIEGEASTRTPSVRLDFFHRRSVQISGFESRNELLFEAISAAWRHGSR
jgi:hypothetical protein